LPDVEDVRLSIEGTFREPCISRVTNQGFDLQRTVSTNTVLKRTEAL